MEDSNGIGGRHQPWGLTRLWTHVAGAGRRLFSAVFGHDTPSTSSSTSSSSNYSFHSHDVAANHFGENEETIVYLKEVDFVDLGGKQLELVGDCTEGSFAFVSKLEPKHAIEKLLMQETFSRDEFVRLVKQIESRVAEPSTNGVVEIEEDMEVDNRANKSDYQRGCGCKSDSPDIQRRAISEAKEWLSENDNELRSKVLKRNLVALGSEEPVGKKRRVRFKSVDWNADSFNFKQFNLFPSSFENEAWYIPPEADTAKPSDRGDEFRPQSFATGLDERKDNEEPKNIPESVDRVSGPCRSCVLALPTREHDKRRRRKCKGQSRRGTNWSRMK